MNNGSIFLHYQISRIMSCIFWIYTHSVFIKCSHIEERVKAFPLFLYTISAKSSVIHDICRLSVHKNPQWRAMHVFAFLQALLPPSVHCGLDITPPPMSHSLPRCLWSYQYGTRRMYGKLNLGSLKANIPGSCEVGIRDTQCWAKDPSIQSMLTWLSGFSRNAQRLSEEFSTWTVAYSLKSVNGALQMILWLEHVKGIISVIWEILHHVQGLGIL